MLNYRQAITLSSYLHVVGKKSEVCFWYGLHSENSALGTWYRCYKYGTKQKLLHNIEYQETIQQLIDAGILIQNISRKEYDVQKALGHKLDYYPAYVLNEELADAIELKEFIEAFEQTFRTDDIEIYGTQL